jgi:hypothetical protein
MSYTLADRNDVARDGGAEPTDPADNAPYKFELYELTLTPDALQKLVSYRRHTLTANRPTKDNAVAGWREESRSYAAEFARMCWRLFAEQHGDEAARLEQGGIA